MTFQLGDVRVSIEGQVYSLRLTMGALAEITHGLGAKSPQALSQCLRRLTPEQARMLLGCLAPASPKPAPISALGDDALTALLPDICRVFEQAFAAPKRSSHAAD